MYWSSILFSFSSAAWRLLVNRWFHVFSWSLYCSLMPSRLSKSSSRDAGKGSSKLDGSRSNDGVGSVERVICFKVSIWFSFLCESSIFSVKSFLSLGLSCWSGLLLPPLFDRSLFVKLLAESVLVSVLVSVQVSVFFFSLASSFSSLIKISFLI